MSASTAARRRGPDRGMQVLELKLSILAQGAARSHRNPALDILTGRVPDERLLSLSASLMATRTESAPEAIRASTPTPIRAAVAPSVAASSPTPMRTAVPTPMSGASPAPILAAVPLPVVASSPTAMVLPLAAIRMAAVARGPRRAPSPWLQATTDARPRLRLVSPPASRWSRVPWLGPVLAWLRVECRPYRWPARSPRAHPVS